MNTRKKNINENIFNLLSESLDEGLEHAKGKLTLKSETLELPPEPPTFSKNRIKKIREQILKVSQPVFASILGCTPSSIKSWERGQNHPNGPAKRLLQLIERDPAYFLEVISAKKGG